MGLLATIVGWNAHYYYHYHYHYHYYYSVDATVHDEPWPLFLQFLNHILVGSR
jgi:hypothetical protein